MLSSIVTNNGDDSDIEKVDKELEGCHFLDVRSPPEKAFVEILSYHRLFPELQCLSATKLSIPVTFFISIVRRSDSGIGGRVRLPCS